MTLKRPKAKIATIVASYQTDLELALNWARLNKMIKGRGAVRELEDSYAVTVKIKKGTKADLRNLLKDRFGVFIKVK